MTTILIVDDSPIVRATMRRVLTAEGYRVVEAENGVEALAEFDGCSPDLLLVDLLMPEMGGVQCVRTLGDRVGRIPAIALHSNFPPSTREACERVGFDGFLEKPLDEGELRTTVRRALRAPGRAAPVS